jgi:hypothetical protein
VLLKTPFDDERGNASVVEVEVAVNEKRGDDGIVNCWKLDGCRSVSGWIVLATTGFDCEEMLREAKVSVRTLRKQSYDPAREFRCGPAIWA